MSFSYQVNFPDNTSREFDSRENMKAAIADFFKAGGKGEVTIRAEVCTDMERQKLNSTKDGDAA